MRKITNSSILAQFIMDQQMPVHHRTDVSKLYSAYASGSSSTTGAAGFKLL